MPARISEDEVCEALAGEVQDKREALAEAMGENDGPAIRVVIEDLKTWASKLKDLPSLMALKPVKSLYRDVKAEIAKAAIWLSLNPEPEVTPTPAPEPTPPKPDLEKMILEPPQIPNPAPPEPKPEPTITDPPKPPKKDAEEDVRPVAQIGRKRM